MTEPWYFKKQRAAVEKVRKELSLPIAEHRDVMDCVENFDPWHLFPMFYGTYSKEFDDCAIDVLMEILLEDKQRRDLAAEMFREVLCTSDLCEYGTSPRVCFATPWFKEVLPGLINKWKEYSHMQWTQNEIKNCRMTQNV